MVEKRILESVIPYILLSQLRSCVEMFYSRSVKPTLSNTRTLFLNVKKKKHWPLMTVVFVLGKKKKSYFVTNHNFYASWGFPWGSAGKETTCSVGDLGSVPELGRSPGEGKGYPLQYSGLKNFMNCIAHGVAKSRTQLGDFHFHFLS